MKLLYALFLCGAVISASASTLDNLSEGDQKWSAVVEKMIADGPATISTPSQLRVEIAKELARKMGRKAEVTQVENSYRITIR